MSQEQLTYLLKTVILIWTLIWKGWALWKAAGKKDKIWFVILFVFNTIGIIEILYIFIFSKMEKLNFSTKKSKNEVGKVEKIEKEEIENNEDKEDIK